MTSSCGDRESEPTKLPHRASHVNCGGSAIGVTQNIADDLQRCPLLKMVCREAVAEQVCSAKWDVNVGTFGPAHDSLPYRRMVKCPKWDDMTNENMSAVALRASPANIRGDRLGDHGEQR